MLARALYGARVSALIGLVGRASMGGLIGTTLGVVGRLLRRPRWTCADVLPDHRAPGPADHPWWRWPWSSVVGASLTVVVLRAGAACCGNASRW
jgi:hypothetical protein